MATPFSLAILLSSFLSLSPFVTSYILLKNFPDLNSFLFLSASQPIPSSLFFLSPFFFFDIYSLTYLTRNLSPIRANPSYLLFSLTLISFFLRCSPIYLFLWARSRCLSSFVSSALSLICCGAMVNTSLAVCCMPVLTPIGIASSNDNAGTFQVLMVDSFVFVLGV